VRSQYPHKLWTHSFILVQPDDGLVKSKHVAEEIQD